jgi:transcriptional regulator with XRE-family HTH domain
LDLTLSEVAAACEISFQQVSKYEAGEAAISVSRLLKLSQMLGVPIAYFIDPPA